MNYRGILNYGKDKTRSDLTRKGGQHSFPLKKAFRKIPKLRKYVTAATRRDLPHRGPGRPRKNHVTLDLSELLAALGEMFTKQGGLKVNVNLTVDFEKSER
jgi:hypothetical protein